MQLTKGQKDALIRQARSIIVKKREDKRRELVAKWKPSPEQKKVLNKVSEIQASILKLQQLLKDSGFTYEYNKWTKEVDKQTVRIFFYDIEGNVSAIHDNMQQDMKTFSVANELEKAAYPDEQDITDEIELLSLSKEFDVEAFLAKYRNL